MSILDETTRRAVEAEAAVRRYRGNGKDHEAKSAPRVEPLNWTALGVSKAPARTWGISHWLGFDALLCAGAGGIGKTLLWQQTATALALGRDFIDSVPRALRVLMWACEDDRDELWRRQEAICAHFEVSLASLAGKFILVPRRGLDNTLYSTEFGRGLLTSLYGDLREEVNDHRADVLVLDNVGQVFGGNENSRHDVTHFVNAGYGLVTGRPFVAVYLAHPAKGVGSEFSGSTAWENAVRMRWLLSDRLPDARDGEAPVDGVRYLAKRKVNYTAKDYRRFTYQNGVLVPDTYVEGSIAPAYRRDRARQLVLEGFLALERMGIRPTDGHSSPDYLPKQLQAKHLDGGFAKRELTEAMNELMAAGRLRRVEVGKYANRGTRWGLELVPQGEG